MVREICPHGILESENRENDLKGGERRTIYVKSLGVKDARISVKNFRLKLPKLEWAWPVGGILSALLSSACTTVLQL